MKHIFYIMICFLLLSLVSIGCVIGAILMALNGISGWGWFLLVAVLTMPCGKTPFSKEKEEEKEDSKTE